MPIYDYQCRSCNRTFELLVRSSAPPVCPFCAGTALERLVSLTAPQGKSKAVVARARQAAAKEGHFSQYSRAERGKVPR